jgi:hypothetical protein
MRRGWAIALAAILAVGLLVAVGVGAYHAGVDAGVTRGADAGHVVEVVGGPAYGWHGGFFFPFGFLFLPLLIIGGILLVRVAVGGPRWGRGWGYGPGYGPGGGRGPWSEEGARFEDRFVDWHRRQHEPETTAPDAGGSPPPAPAG